VGKWAVVCAGKACMGERCILVHRCRRCKWRDAVWRDAVERCIRCKWRDSKIQVEPVHTTPSFNMYLVKINTIMISALKHLY